MTKYFQKQRTEKVTIINPNLTGTLCCVYVPVTRTSCDVS